MAAFDPKDWIDPYEDADSELEVDLRLELEAAPDSKQVNVHSSSNWEVVTSLGTTYEG